MYKICSFFSVRNLRCISARILNFLHFLYITCLLYRHLDCVKSLWVRVRGAQETPFKEWPHGCGVPSCLSWLYGPTIVWHHGYPSGPPSAMLLRSKSAYGTQCAPWNLMMLLVPLGWEPQPTIPHMDTGSRIIKWEDKGPSVINMSLKVLTSWIAPVVVRQCCAPSILPGIQWGLPVM